MSDSEVLTAAREPRAELPSVTAEVRLDGHGFVDVDGVREDLVGDDLADVGSQVTARIAEVAAEVGRPLPAQVRDPDGIWRLLIHPDGRVDEAPPEATDSATRGLLAIPDPAPAPAAASGATPPGRVMPTSAPATPASAPRPAPTHGAATPGAVPRGAETRGAETRGAETRGAETRGAETRGAAAHEAYHPHAADPVGAVAAHPGVAGGPVPRVTGTAESSADLGELLAPRRRERPGHATRGFRRVVRALTLGVVRPGPGKAERAHHDAVDAVRRGWEGPRTVVVINPKGGAHKTTASLLLASQFGLVRGGYTLAWDNNETHGTLGWRSAAQVAGGTATDLLRELPDLAARGEIRVGDLDAYVRTQPAEQFDVLASDEDAASGAFVDADSFGALHEVLSRFYRVIVVDTGNNIRASNWRAAVAAADQLVIVSTIREDTAQSAAWAVDALRAAGMADRVRRAVTILSAADQKTDKDLLKRLRQHFGVLTRAVVEVPFDPALVVGGPIDYPRLKPATREAWLRAAAAVADGL